MRLILPGRRLLLSTRLIAVLVVTVGFALPTSVRCAELSPAAKTATLAPTDRHVSFTNDIVPIFTKTGCSAGVCHAKAGGGQNGFQLSLYGFEPAEDFDHLVLEGRGRRIFPAAPEQSLVLQKASGQIPHGGGVRIETGSIDYESLRQWIAQGALFQRDGDPVLTAIELDPKNGILKPDATEQLLVVAHYSDDTTRDVTRLALFESNDLSMLEVSESGSVTSLDVPGKASVMVRYLDKAAVYSAAIPIQRTQSSSKSGASDEPAPQPNGFIDELVLRNLETLGIPPSSICNDATFLRRVTLDVAGRLPTIQETETFLADKSDKRRDRVIDSLLQSPGYADFFANKWTSLLKNRRDDKTDITSNFAFHAWIRDSLLANRPYDQMVRELLAATGAVISNPPVAWYKRVKDPKQQMEDVAQLFLGVRMKCAQCHHHPFERWSQEDYYGLAAFFSQVGRKATATEGEDMIFHKRGKASLKNIKTGEPVAPRALGDSVGDIMENQDPRLKLADWMQSDANPFFAKALVNRYWKHFFRRGLVEPEDDIRDTNPPTNPELLSALERHFIESGFDLQELVRVMTRSTVYQIQSTPNDLNLADRQNYSRFYPKRLQAEVLLDAIDDLAGAKTHFANLPVGTRAIALPDNSYNASSAFLKTFGRPERTSVCECERSQTASLGQSLHFLNASDLQTKLGDPNGLVETLIKQDATTEECVDRIYLTAFSRKPTPAERETSVSYLAEPRVSAEGKPVDTATQTRDSLQDLLWAIVNTKEFQFNH